MTAKLEKFYGKLTVLGPSSKRDKSKSRFWTCHCECGTVTEVNGANLRSGNTKSCGCAISETLYQVKTIHGLSFNRFYSVHKNMMLRCYDPTHKAYKNYGARGIYVCKEWHEISVFVKWCEKQNPFPGLTLERNDNNGPYAPWNCGFKSYASQLRNTRRSKKYACNGKMLILKDIISELNLSISESTLKRYLKLSNENLDAALKIRKYERVRE